MSFKWSDSLPLVGIGILGVIHEFVISDKAEALPLIIFFLLIIKGLEYGFKKK
jgi:hypothetical protein